MFDRSTDLGRNANDNYEVVVAYSRATHGIKEQVKEYMQERIYMKCGDVESLCKNIIMTHEESKKYKNVVPLTSQKNTVGLCWSDMPDQILSICAMLRYFRIR
jgi:hypothetical protein